MDSKELARLKDHLDRANFEVISPSIPFVLEGPDLLVRHGQRALIVFIPRKSEQSAPSLLAGRISGSLLAYPSYVEAVINISEPDSSHFALGLDGLVPVTTSTTDLMRFASRRTERKSSQSNDLRRIKQLHMRRVGRITEASETRGAISLKATSSEVAFQMSANLRARNKGDRALFGVRAAQTQEGLRLALTSARSARRAAVEVTHASYSSLYQLDNAVPYPTTNTVDKGLWADDMISEGREYALWFALVHALPKANR